MHTAHIMYYGFYKGIIAVLLWSYVYLRHCTKLSLLIYPSKENLKGVYRSQHMVVWFLSKSVEGATSTVLVDCSETLYT